MGSTSYRGLNYVSFTITLVYKEVSITRKCHNYRPQTNPRHHEEETQNTDTHTTTLILTHLSQMEFRLLSVGSVHFRFKSCWVGFFSFYSIFIRTFCKQRVENLIRRRVVRRLIWVCTVCICPIKSTLGLYGVNG